jgi:hypothetical protein
LPKLPLLTRTAAKTLFGNKINNIGKTMEDLDTKTYEDVIFDYF